jgi:hypothetical protein
MKFKLAIAIMGLVLFFLSLPWVMIGYDHYVRFVMGFAQ